MEEIIIHTTKEKEIVDITEHVQKVVAERGLEEGICHLLCLHTTAALTTADLDYGTDQDMLDAFEHIVPKLQYRHPHNPGHVKDHVMATIIGASLSIPIEQSKLILGTWQRIILVEFGGPRERNIVVSLSGVI